MQALLLRTSRDVLDECLRPASTTSTVQASEQQQPQVTSAAPNHDNRLVHNQKQAAHRQIKTETLGLQVGRRNTLVEG